MGRLKRYLFVAAAVIVLFVISGLSYFFFRFPDIDSAPSLSIEKTPQRLERGRYLASNVSGCIDCHSTRNWKYYAGPITKGTEGKGGELFDESIGIPGALYSANITPAGIGSLTDGELFRAITSGVTKDGRVLFPLMPYSRYNNMTDEDIYSIIAYIRTFPAVENNVAPSHVNFPVNYIIRTVPSPHRTQPEPNQNDPYEYGKYLVNAAACADCHTPQSNGKPIQGKEFAGGMEFNMPQGLIRSANITPDEETGIGNWSKEAFIARFKSFAAPGAAQLSSDTMKSQTIMPWIFFSGMKEEDLGAIYTYLRTIQPVKNQVEHFTPPNK